MPTAGVSMVIDHAWWPYAAMIGGGAFVDAEDREAAKVFGLRKRGVRTGSPPQRRLATGVFLYLIVIGGLAIVIGSSKSREWKMGSDPVFFGLLCPWKMGKWGLTPFFLRRARRRPRS